VSAPVATLCTLEALLLRAGASDTDREAWLAERRSGVTATEVRDLKIGAVTFAQLADRKLGRLPESFAGNAYTQWGVEREPEIARWLEAGFSILPESRVFHAADDPRKLASPDGVGVSFDGDLLISEVKTAGAKYDLTPGSDDFSAKGYGYQVQWGLRVLGAQRALFAWEERLGFPGNFSIGQSHIAWIERDELVIAELDKLADDFLAFWDARALDPFVMPDVDDEVDTHAVNYLRFLAEESEAGASKTTAYEAILALVGEKEEFRQEGQTARVTLTPIKNGTADVVDLDAAKKANPDLWGQLRAAQAAWDAHVAGFSRTVQTSTKPKLTITVVKPKGQKA
jgi:hypothetical protein